MIVSDDREQTEFADEAARWFIRLDAGPLNPDERREFDAWQAQCPEHRKLLQEMTDLWSSLDRLPNSAHPLTTTTSSTHPMGTVRRRRHVIARWAGGTAIAASVAFCLLWVSGEWAVLTSDYRTSAGEQRTVTLADGSFVHLNTASALSVHFTSDGRRVNLIKGDAVFDVSADTSRPFQVEAGPISATALGTQFLVQRDDGRVSVTVLDHRVSVTEANTSSRSHTETHVTLDSGQRVSYEPSQGLSGIQEADLRSAVAWRRGKIIFEGETLGTVIDQLNRYHRGRIVIIDPEVGRMRVNGVFQTADSAKVITALEQTLRIHSTRLTDYFILLHR
ncbi:MAG: FecR family protein [Nitrospira sp.]